MRLELHFPRLGSTVSPSFSCPHFPAPIFLPSSSSRHLPTSRHNRFAIFDHPSVLSVDEVDVPACDAGSLPLSRCEALVSLS